MADQSFAGIRTRLDQIVEEVSAEDISLDEALALYEEAVKLGLKACDLSEEELLEQVEGDDDEAADQDRTLSAADSVETASSADNSVSAH